MLVSSDSGFGEFHEKGVAVKEVDGRIGREREREKERNILQVFDQLVIILKV